MHGEEGMITPLKSPLVSRQCPRLPARGVPRGGGQGSPIHRAVAAAHGVHLTLGFVGNFPKSP